MKCNYREYDEMACGYICTNPKNKINAVHEKICHNQDKCMVRYQNDPLCLVEEIITKHITMNEKLRDISMMADVSYIALNNMKCDLESSLKLYGVKIS